MFWASLRPYDALELRYASLAEAFLLFVVCVIVFPLADDIIREGSNLHHCVGTYVSKVADGRSAILFVRRLSNPKKSYYTIEYSDNKVVQLKGFGNQDPPENVSNFVDKWQESIMKRAA